MLDSWLKWPLVHFQGLLAEQTGPIQKRWMCLFAFPGSLAGNVLWIFSERLELQESRVHRLPTMPAAVSWIDSDEEMRIQDTANMHARWLRLLWIAVHLPLVKKIILAHCALRGSFAKTESHWIDRIKDGWWDKYSTRTWLGRRFPGVFVNIHTVHNCRWKKLCTTLGMYETLTNNGRNTTYQQVQDFIQQQHEYNIMVWFSQY